MNKITIINKNLLKIPFNFSTLFFFGRLIALIIIAYITVLLIVKGVKYSALLISVRSVSGNKGKNTPRKIFILLSKISIIELFRFFNNRNLGIGFGFPFYFLLYLINF